MEPTAELRTRLRRLIDERIPSGGTDADTRFTDAEIDDLLTEASSIEEAAAAGWRQKAAWAMSERGGLEKSRAGDEAHEFVSLETYRDHCLKMAAHYADQVPGRGSRLLEFDPPEIYETGDES